MANPGRQAVVVLGMHRGGTSALAGTTVRLGLASPRTPLPASDDNPAGFYEAVPVVEVNHVILAAAGCRWDACLIFDPVRVSEMLSPADRQFVIELLRSEFGDAASFVLKDPRLCLTLPAWLPALHAIGAGVRVLIAVRHPGEVVRSLAVRNRLTEAEVASHWLHHMLEAERVSRGQLRAVVSYDDLMRDWRSCMARAATSAGVRWPRPIDASVRDIDAFLALASRHHRAQDPSAAVGAAPVRDMVSAAWLAFRHLAANPEAGVALTWLDQIHTRFAEWRLAAARGNDTAQSPLRARIGSPAPP